MALEVIGAGVGRTGTLSLKTALEMLGYNKTYHMVELFRDPSRLEYWEGLENEEEIEFEKLFEGYTAAVDFPPSLYYKTLHKKYPDAKIILTERDPEKWYKSAMDTIYGSRRKGIQKFMLRAGSIFSKQSRNILNITDYIDDAIWLGFFKGQFHNKEVAIKRYLDWNAEVKRVTPAEKLLVFNVQQGWEPLCRFLGKDVPSKNFPRTNSTDEFLNNRKKLGK